MPTVTTTVTGGSNNRAMVDLCPTARVHLLGVGGAGMSAIAVVLRGLGCRVSGSDLAGSPVLDRLREIGVDVFVGHHVANMPDADLVARSTAVGDDNPEVVAARQAGIPVYRRAEILTAITALRSTVAVAGTHGKTTTAAMLSHILMAVGADPGFIVGAVLADGSIGARWSEGPWLVVEADESDGTFGELIVSRAVVTSVEPDHLRRDRPVAELEAEFARFCAGAADGLVVCADDAGAVKASESRDGVFYGTGPDADYRWTTLRRDRHMIVGEVTGRDVPPGPVTVPMPGDHNALNALGALAMARELGVDWSDAANAMAGFEGVTRRFERRGTAAGVDFIDDYAHLPTEVACALKAASEGGWDRVVCVFQPHRYTRTSHLWTAFAHCFEAADAVIITDVYSAGESAIPGVSGKLIWQAVTDAHPDWDVSYVERLDDAADHLVGVLRPGDLCLTLGAGDLTDVPGRVISMLAGRR
ncbi:UDP-N-acetylmuramate--L-alanine ligase [Candidatus Poriferisocius sp.]|uniref:UDP-N-acetylmuramate--L-alanine ligase n=1 Tax=Candidatus Poriferisocius sp. TaxID=3101276 RepID=UPI003B51BCB1